MTAKPERGNKMREESTRKIVEAYNTTLSVKAVSKETGYSWQKIVKALSSEGIIVNDLHYQISRLHDNGKSVEQIAKELEVSESTVQAYLPRVRPIYNEHLSQNAQRIKKCRERQNQTKGL